MCVVGKEAGLGSLNVIFEKGKPFLEGDGIGSKGLPEVDKVLLLESPVVQPFLHHIYEFDDALGLELNRLLHLAILLLVGVMHPQNEVAHQFPFLLQTHLLVAEDLPVDVLQRGLHSLNQGLEVLDWK